MEKRSIKVLPFISGAVLCLVCLVSFTWAWFTTQIKAGPYYIKTAAYDLKITVEDGGKVEQNGSIYTLIASEASESGKALTKYTSYKMFTVTMTPNDLGEQTAPIGYGVIEGTDNSASIAILRSVDPDEAKLSPDGVVIVSRGDATVSPNDAVISPGDATVSPNDAYVVYSGNAADTSALYTIPMTIGEEITFQIAIPAGESYSFELTSSWGTASEETENLVTNNDILLVAPKNEN